MHSIYTKKENNMYRHFKALTLLSAFGFGALITAPMLAEAMPSRGNQVARNLPGSYDARIAHEVRHELLMLPYYGVFDNLEFRVDDGSVTLFGQVTRPMLKSDAEGVVKHIEGVEFVDNQIQVLPLSSMDDRIRIAVFRAVYGQAPLNQYALRAVPTIHIIVENGHVTLEGAVARQADKDIANVTANTVPGVFSVTNNLRVNS
ncbi:MAG: BON domain-containing protein [Bryobacteraceae bacterium]